MMKKEEMKVMAKRVPGQKWFKRGLVTTGVGAVGMATAPALGSTMVGSTTLFGSTLTVAATVGALAKATVFVGAAFMLKGIYDGVFPSGAMTGEVKKELVDALEALKRATSKGEVLTPEVVK